MTENFYSEQPEINREKILGEVKASLQNIANEYGVQPVLANGEVDMTTQEVAILVDNLFRFRVYMKFDGSVGLSEDTSISGGVFSISFDKEGEFQASKAKDLQSENIEVKDETLNRIRAILSRLNSQLRKGTFGLKQDIKKQDI